MKRTYFNENISLHENKFMRVPFYLKMGLRFTTISFAIVLLLWTKNSYAQEGTETMVKKDSVKIISLNTIVITAPRTETLLKEFPAAISIVNTEQINTMTKSIAADEVLRLVPGVRVENGTDGSRVHLYIRGQGVLSESGLRGIGVLIDGIPVSSPGGFTPDLYDVDWATVKNVEVVKGLAASMYGGCANGGVINIITNNGGEKPFSATLLNSLGSYGFRKTMAQIGGTKDNVNYRISYSHTQGDGYRIHQAFMGDILSEKLNWSPSKKVKITQLLTYTSYFNQNSEGINLGRYDTVGPRAANTDAIPYNEFHKTQRLTGGTVGSFNINNNQNITVKGFFRLNNYRETSNNGDDYKPFINSGVSAQYNINVGKENLVNHISLGGDFETQTMTEHEFAVPDEDHINHNRVDNHFSETSFDTEQLLINQISKQQSTGIYLIDKLDISKKFFATLNLRNDYIYNRLTENIPMPDSLSSAGNKTFQKTTYRLGLAYDVAKSANIYINYGTGFLAPTEDELYNNPVRWGGFNSIIKPSTSQGGEIGLRGDLNKTLYFDITGFSIRSTNEFYRYSVIGRGNNTAFFGNFGSSIRNGFETYLSFAPSSLAKLEVAYTYSDFKYTSPDSVKNHRIPQCPKHMLNAEISIKPAKGLTIAFNAEYQSKWCIQVDDSLYNNYTENGVKKSSWYNGFSIFSANLKYNFKLWRLNSEISFFAKNLFDEHYFGFTEPNNGTDYNSYQPAPGREFFVSLKFSF